MVCSCRYTLVRVAEPGLGVLPAKVTLSSRVDGLGWGWTMGADTGSTPCASTPELPVAV